LLARPEKDFSQLEAGLAYLPAFPPAKVIELLEQRAEVLRAEIEQFEATHEQLRAMGLPQLFWVESEFRLELIRTEAEFASRLADRIRNDELEGAGFWRQGYELVEKLGIPMTDLLSDPVKYFGEEFPWLQEVPPEAR
jgi:hypothetical protein